MILQIIEDILQIIIRSRSRERTYLLMMMNCTKQYLSSSSRNRGKGTRKLSNERGLNLLNRIKTMLELRQLWISNVRGLKIFREDQSVRVRRWNVTRLVCQGIIWMTNRLWSCHLWKICYQKRRNLKKIASIKNPFSPINLCLRSFTDPLTKVSYQKFKRANPRKKTQKIRAPYLNRSLKHIIRVRPWMNLSLVSSFQRCKKLRNCPSFNNLRMIKS